LIYFRKIARHASAHALVTDACSTKVRIAQAADELFPDEKGPLFLGGHPMAGRDCRESRMPTPISSANILTP